MKKVFLDYLKSIGFNISEVQNSLPLVPSYYRTKDGHHFIQSAIHICVFGGSNTPKDELGCVTFSLHGKQRNKYCRNTNDRPEAFKHAFCPKSAQEAIQAFELWNKSRHAEMKASWKKVL